MNDLLEKYWNGESTLLEEQQLRDYFSSEKVSTEHEVYRSLFNTFELEQGMKEGDFDAFAKVQYKTQPDLGTYETPEEARAAALNMLELVSVKLNKGRSNMKPLQTLDNKTAAVFNLK